MSDRVTFYHNPMSRGPCVHWMLEEVGATYDVKILDFEKREHKTPEFLAVNPMGKIPAIVHRGVVVTETAAILLFFAVSCIEPALIDRALSRSVPADGYVPYGSYENVLNALETAFAPGPFILGQRFSAADVFVASQLNSGLKTRALEPRPAFTQYVERCTARPAFKRTCG